TDVGLRDAVMISANLEGAKFLSTDWRLSSDHFSDFRGIRAADAKAINATFGGKLRRANFDHADLREASFGLSDLTLASLKSADLRGANLNQTILFAANLDRAQLQGAN